MSYSYDLQTTAFDIYTSYASSHEPADNKYLLLTTITHPTGGETRFGYQKYTKKINDNDEEDPSWFDTFRLSSRRAILGGVQTNYRFYTYNNSDSEGKYSRVYTYAQELYKANLTKTTIQQTHANINFEYDPVYHAYISHAYIEGVNNPYFNVYNEIIGNQYHYDYFGRVQRKTDARGSQVEYTYDNLDRIIRQYHLSDWTSKLIKYYDAANKVVVEDEEGYPSIFYYDQLGRPIAGYGDDGAGNEIRLYEKRYDQMGRVFGETDGDDVTTYYAYDAIGRVIKIIHPDDTPEIITDNPLTEIIYDDMDNRKAVIDPNGSIRVIEMDNSENVLRVF